DSGILHDGPVREKCGRAPADRTNTAKIGLGAVSSGRQLRPSCDRFPARQTHGYTAFSECAVAAPEPPRWPPQFAPGRSGQCVKRLEVTTRTISPNGDPRSPQTLGEGSMIKTAPRQTAAQVILLAADDLMAQGASEFTEWELTIASWIRDRARFGLRGYAQDHPDHKRVMMEIMGKKPHNPVLLGHMEK